MTTCRAECRQGRVFEPMQYVLLLSALLLFAGNCHGLASEASEVKGRLQYNGALHQHRKLQQHLSNNVAGADLGVTDITAHQPRLQHHRQAHSVPSFTDQSQTSHDLVTESNNVQRSRQHQHNESTALDKGATISEQHASNSHDSPVDAAVEHILYPNSPQWRENDTQWHDVHESYVKQLASGQKFDFILYGDSIFESLLGSVVGNPVERAAGLPEVWSQFHNTDTDRIFALAGDGASDMVWRLKNGETPAAGQVKQIVLLIGSNDLDYYWDSLEDLTQREQSVKSVVGSISLCVDILASACPSTEIFVMSVMHKGVRWLGPEEIHILPNRFTPAIDAINQELQKVSDSWPSGHVQFVDCSYFFVNHDAEGNPTGMNADLVPDTLHPNPVGFHKILTECIEPGVHRTLSEIESLDEMMA